MITDEDPTFDATYLADQKLVKTIERTVSLEPLDTFRTPAVEESPTPDEEDDADDE